MARPQRTSSVEPSVEVLRAFVLVALAAFLVLVVLPSILAVAGMASR